jgi:hypothetical protein
MNPLLHILLIFGGVLLWILISRLWIAILRLAIQFRAFPRLTDRDAAWVCGALCFVWPIGVPILVSWGFISWVKRTFTLDLNVQDHLLNTRPLSREERQKLIEETQKKLQLVVPKKKEEGLPIPTNRIGEKLPPFE